MNATYPRSSPSPALADGRVGPATPDPAALLAGITTGMCWECDGQGYDDQEIGPRHRRRAKKGL